MYGLRGDNRARAVWLDIVGALETPGRPVTEIHLGEFFDALLLLHRGLPEPAARLMDTAPEQLDAADRLRRARLATAGNPIATAIVDRAAALTAGDRDGLIAAAVALQDAGCRYQWARTLILIGGQHQSRGESELAGIGATPMVWPPEQC
jgi:hypothetical protein